MSSFSIAAVMRAGEYSPNHIGNDAAIMHAVIKQLNKRGCKVNIYSETEFQTKDVKENIILNMCREQASVAKLQKMEDNGCLVINSGYGIENCTRERMTRLLLANKVPYPDSLMVDTNAKIIDLMKHENLENVWLKRGDFHAMHKEDITYCRHPREAEDTLHEYFLRGIPRAVINRHLPGDLIKFYGIRNQPYFYWFYPFDEGHSKYGWEKVNGKSNGIHFDEHNLCEICAKAADVLDVDIYGGDCIISPDGTIRIIDFNDWPSFAPCRTEAAPYIAKAVIAKIKKFIKEKN